MNKKLCILLVLVVLCSATLADKSKETSKEKSKEKSKENSKEESGSKEKSNENSSKEETNTAGTTTTVASSDRCAGQPDGTILPSLTACANFVTCQGETEAAEATCVPNGTIFDSTRGVCDYEPNVQCTIEGETTTEVATTAPEPTQNELKGMCKGVVIAILSHPGNCNKYIICVLGKPTIQSCGKNEIFYSDISVCAFGDPKTC